MSSKLLLFSLLLATAVGHTSPSYNEKMIVKFYAKNEPQIQSEYLREVVRGTEKWMKRVHLSDQVDTLLSMGHRESEYDMYADDKDLVGLAKHSVGIYQTRADYRMWLRSYWKLRGYSLGADDSLDTQIAFGVAEFRVHINRARGVLWTGVRMYNGRGPGALDYARKVFHARSIIFKHKHYLGEKVPIWDGLNLSHNNQ